MKLINLIISSHVVTHQIPWQVRVLALHPDYLSSTVSRRKHVVEFKEDPGMAHYRVCLTIKNAVFYNEDLR